MHQQQQLKYDGYVQRALVTREHQFVFSLSILNQELIQRQNPYTSKTQM
jgi:hypothetical protein